LLLQANAGANHVANCCQHLGEVAAVVRWISTAVTKNEKSGVADALSHFLHRLLEGRGQAVLVRSSGGFAGERFRISSAAFAGRSRAMPARKTRERKSSALPQLVFNHPLMLGALGADDQERKYSRDDGSERRSDRPNAVPSSASIPA